MEKWSHFTISISLAAPARSMDIELILMEDPIDFASRRFLCLSDDLTKFHHSTLYTTSAAKINTWS